MAGHSAKRPDDGQLPDSDASVQLAGTLAGAVATGRRCRSPSPHTSRALAAMPIFMAHAAFLPTCLIPVRNLLEYGLLLVLLPQGKDVGVQLLILVEQWQQRQDFVFVYQM